MRKGFWRDTLATSLLWLLALTTLALLLWILSDLVLKGFSGLSWSYLTEAPKSGGRSGGIFPLVVSTLTVLVIGLCLAVPIGLWTAVYLAFSPPTWFSRALRRLLIVLSALPSLLLGLFGLLFFADVLGLGVCLLSGGLTVGVMVLPIFARGTEESFRQVPQELQDGAAALGVGFGPTFFSIILPSSTAMMGASLALSAGRILGESASLLLTAGPSLRMPDSAFDQGRVLAYHIYVLASELPGGKPAAYTASVVLVILVLLVDLVAISIADKLFRREKF